jgi:ATP-dependent exoDNAse (exonuclease V) beta subunit
MTAPTRWPRPRTLGEPNTPLQVVEASAGTGKTYFLEHKVVDLLLGADATIDRIVVVTYTDKATAELRARIRRLLTQMVWGAPPPAPADAPAWTLDAVARGRLRDALDRVDAAPISTIHGFCQRVLADEAFAAGRSFEQEAVPDEAALYTAFLAALRERFARAGEDCELLRAFLADGKTPDQLFRWVLSLYRFDAPLADARPATHQVLVARVLGEVVARADRQKQRGGQLDFHDMLRLTDRALDADAGLAGRLATRLPWALIDEFQDTDPIQWRIASKIWRRPPARALVIVGDPKQAIYSFRGGDVHTYLAATARAARDAGAAAGDPRGQPARDRRRWWPRSTACMARAGDSLFSRLDASADDPPGDARRARSALTWADGRAGGADRALDRSTSPTSCLTPPAAALFEATADEIAAADHLTPIASDHRSCTLRGIAEAAIGPERHPGS